MRNGQGTKSRHLGNGGSGNVFADMRLPRPEEELTKAQLASHIRQVIKRQHLTQVAAAARMGIDQPKVSALLNGRLANFSSERLMRLLTALVRNFSREATERRTVTETEDRGESAHGPPYRLTAGRTKSFGTLTIMSLGLCAISSILDGRANDNSWTN